MLLLPLLEHNLNTFLQLVTLLIFGYVERKFPVLSENKSGQES